MDVTTCSQCGAELIFTMRGMSGARSEYQVEPECERCGVVRAQDDGDVPGTDDVDRTPAPHIRAFPPMAPASSPRPRGLTLGDVNAVVRASRAQPKAAAWYLDPASPPSTRP